MPDRLPSRPPVQDRVYGHAGGPCGWGGSKGLDGHVEEPYLTETGLFVPFAQLLLMVSLTNLACIPPKSTVVLCT